MERKDGYYWVKFDGEYEVAQYYLGYWLRCGNEYCCNDDCFEWIADTPIEILF